MLVTTNKTYTKNEIQLFEKMIDIKIERMAYYLTSLTPNGLMEEKEPYNTDYSAANVELTLPNGGESYEIHYADGFGAEEIALEAFNKFLELDKNEEAFKVYLENKTNFTPI